MARAGGKQRRSSRSIVGLIVALTVVLAGCAPTVPDTLTPHQPTSSQEAGGPTDPSQQRPEDAPGGSTAGSTTESPDELTAAPTDSQGSPGNGDTHQGRGQKAPVSDEDLINLAAQMTAALESGAVEQWMALTALSGDAAQQQRDWFAGVLAVPMEVREMHPTWLLKRDVDGVVDGPLVEFSFRHQVSGADVVPVLEIYELTLERVGADGPYRVVEVSGSESADSAYPQLWDLRAVEVVETEHTVLIAEAGSDVQALADPLELGAEALFDDFPVDGVDRMVVTVVDESLVATVFGDSDEGAYAGFAMPVAGSASVERGLGLPGLQPDDAVGARLVIDQEYAEDEWHLFGEPEGGLPLMRHEGLHLAMLLRYPDGDPPRWAVEGLAGWFEVIGDAKVRASHEQWYSFSVTEDDLPDALPPSGYHDFFGEDDLVERHYLEAANVFLYVDDDYGADRTAALGDALHRYNQWTQDGAALDEVFVEQLGVDQAEFEQGYLRWVGETFG